MYVDPNRLSGTSTQSAPKIHTTADPPGGFLPVRIWLIRARITALARPLAVAASRASRSGARE